MYQIKGKKTFDTHSMNIIEIDICEMPKKLILVVQNIQFYKQYFAQLQNA